MDVSRGNFIFRNHFNEHERRMILFPHLSI